MVLPAGDLDSFQLGMVTRGAIPFVLPCLLVENGGTRSLCYRAARLQPLGSGREDKASLPERVLLAKRLVILLSEIEEEFSIPPESVVLDGEHVFLDARGEPHVVIGGTAGPGMAVFLAGLLGDGWKREYGVPEDRSGWLEMLDWVLAESRARTAFLESPPEDPPADREPGWKNWLRFATLRDLPVPRHVPAGLVLGGLFLAGLVLSLFL